MADLGWQTDGGPAEARSNGHLLVFGDGSRIYDVAPDGTMTHVAGCGCDLPGQDIGDGGPATEAELGPRDVEPTSDGGFLITDVHYTSHGQQSFIRKVDADGTISTAFGPGGPYEYNGMLSRTSDGEMLLTQDDGAVVRQIDSEGNFSTVAGTGTAGFTGDGGPATDARISASNVDATPGGGFLITQPAYYVGDDHHPTCRIREVDSGGDIDTVAGNGATFTDPSDVTTKYCETLFGQPFTDGVPALETPIGAPRFVEALSSGGFLISTIGYLLEDSPDGTLSAVAGIGYGGSGGDGCPAKDVAVDSLSGVVSSGAAVYYVDYSGIVGDKAHWLLRSISEGTVTHCDLIGIDGSSQGDNIDGGQYHEKILAGGGADSLDAGGGADKLSGQDGGDVIDAGGGGDTVSGGSGADKIDVAGGGTDTVNCGAGHDVVQESGSDHVASNCEVVK